MASLPVGGGGPPARRRPRHRPPLLPGLVLRHRAFLAACAAVGLLIGLVVALVQTPEYQAGVMLQIEPPPPTFASVSDALMVGSGGYWQNTDFYNTQFRVLRSKGLGEKVVARLKLTDREPFKSSIDPRRALHEPRRRRARPREPAGAGHGHAPRPARGGALGEHARRRLHRAVARHARRVGAPGDGVAAGAARRHAAGHARRAGPPVPELQEPGPVRARGQRHGGEHLDRQAAGGLRAGAGAPDRDRGGAQAGERDARRAARSSTRCRRSPPTRS